MPRVKTDMRVHEELAMLAHKISDLEQQLKEEKKMQTRLMYDVDTKSNQLQVLEKSIKSEEENHISSFQKFNNETSFLENKSSESNLALQKRKDALEYELSISEIVEYENKHLLNKLKTLTLEYDELKVQRERDKEDHKQQCFDSRMKMEDILRKEIKSLDLNLKGKANETLLLQANAAKLENRALYTELHNRGETSSILIEHQQRNYEELRKSEIEYEVLDTASNFHEKSILDIRELVHSQEKRKSIIQAQYEHLERNLHELQKDWIKVMKLTDTLIKLEESYQTLQNQHQKTRTKTIKFVQDNLTNALSLVERKQKIKSNELLRVETSSVSRTGLFGKKAKLVKTFMRLHLKDGRDGGGDTALTRASSYESTASSVQSDDTPTKEESPVSQGHRSEFADSPPHNNSRGMSRKMSRLDLIEESENAWNSNKLKLPQISGNIRKAILQQEEKVLRALLSQEEIDMSNDETALHRGLSDLANTCVSVSMTKFNRLTKGNITSSDPMFTGAF